MSVEQGSDEARRLRSTYQGMSDGELVTLGEDRGDLTPAAREALRVELSKRGLNEPRDGTADLDREVGMPTAADLMPSNLGATGPEIELMVLYDAMVAGRACESLEEGGIPFHVADLAEERAGLGSLEGGPAVALRITVPLTEVGRAKALLRSKMGLFPLQEVETADEVVDDGTRTAVGYFGSREEAQEIAGILTGAGFANWVLENPEGNAAEENRFAVEVREVDLFAAGEAVDKALEVEEL